MPVTAPLVVEIAATVQNAGATSADSQVIGVAPFAGTVTAVTYVPDDDITGHDTNTRTVTLTNREGDGGGTDTVAELAFASGVDAAQYVPETITLSGTAANLVLAEGDVLSWDSADASSGTADPGGLVMVTLARN